MPRRHDDSAVDAVSLGPRPRILVVKLATLGDLLLTTPLLRVLRRRYPDARLDVLTTPSSAPLLATSALVDNIFALDALDAPIGHGYRKGASLLPTLTRYAGRLCTLRQTGYDALALAHHLTLPTGRWKHRALVAAIRPRLAVGLDNGHGAWLDTRVPDLGFGAIHEADYFLRLAEGLDARSTRADRRLDANDLGWGDLVSDRSALGQSPRVALHPGSGLYSIARRWPVESFAELARQLHERRRAYVVIIAGPAERDLADRLIGLLGHPDWVSVQTTSQSPRRLAETLVRCDLFVGNDSFPMHLAAALNTPTVAVFGPSNVRAWGPYAPGAGLALAVRKGDLACSPCIYRGHSLGTPRGCPERLCLTRLPAPAVLEAALRLLGQRNAPASPAG